MTADCFNACQKTTVVQNNLAGQKFQLLESAKVDITLTQIFQIIIFFYSFDLWPLLKIIYNFNLQLLQYKLLQPCMHASTQCVDIFAD